MVKLNVRDRESIQEAVRRFRKLVERSGIKKEMRRKEYYEKPSETRRRARLRAERRDAPQSTWPPGLGRRARSKRPNTLGRLHLFRPAPCRCAATRKTAQQGPLKLPAIPAAPRTSALPRAQAHRNSRSTS